MCFVQVEEADHMWLPCPGETGNVYVVYKEPAPEPLPHGAKALFIDLLSAHIDNEPLVITSRRVKLLCNILGLEP